MVMITGDITGENDAAIVMMMIDLEEKIVTLDMSETGIIEIAMNMMRGKVLEEEEKEITNQIEGDVIPSLMMRKNKRGECVAMLKNEIEIIMLPRVR